MPADLDWADHALILLTIEDVTQQQADLARLRDADHQKDEFLAMLGHELRNPLAAIRNGLIVWQRGVADAATVKDVQAAVQRRNWITRLVWWMTCLTYPGSPGGHRHQERPYRSP